MVKTVCSIDLEIGAHTWAKPAFLHTVYAPFYGAPSVYALVSKMAARVAYRITTDTYYEIFFKIKIAQNINIRIISYAICKPGGHSGNQCIHARRSIKWGVNGVQKLLFRPGMSANLDVYRKYSKNQKLTY